MNLNLQRNAEFFLENIPDKSRLGRILDRYDLCTMHTNNFFSHSKSVKDIQKPAQGVCRVYMQISDVLFPETASGENDDMHFIDFLGILFDTLENGDIFVK